MRRFGGISILTLASSIVLSLIVYRGLKVLEKDVDYQKIFDSKYESMIIGCSPIELLNVELITRSLNQKNSEYARFGNFAFDLTLSRYGPLYEKKVFEKLSINSDKERVFVLSITPWNVSADEKSPNDPALFVENDKLIGFDVNPPFPRIRYFFTHYTKPYYTLLFPTKKEVKSNEVPSQEMIDKFQAAKVGYYKKNYVKQKISDIRYQSFESLIKKLKEYGKVYIVRMPVSRPMIDLETDYAPEFDKKVYKSIERLHVGLIDFLPYSNNFLCPDGNHLISEDSDKVSMLLGDIIRLSGSEKLDPKDLVRGYLNSEEALYTSFLTN